MSNRWLLAVGRSPENLASANGERPTANEIANEHDETDDEHHREDNGVDRVHQRDDERRRADDSGSEGRGSGDVIPSGRKTVADARGDEQRSGSEWLQAGYRESQRRIEGDECDEDRRNRDEPEPDERGSPHVA